MDRAQRLATQEQVTRLADGDRAVLAPLFETLWPVLRDFCRRSLASEADGDDAAQEAMIKVFARVSSFDRDRDALTWALAIAAWECRTVARRRGRRREDDLSHAAHLVDGGSRIDDELSSRQLAAAATAVLGTLRPDDVAAVLAAVSDEPAARAGLAPATSRKRLERALGRLRTAWRSRHDVL